MYNGGFNDEIWDEFKWESHLDEIEKKSDQLRKFIAADSSGNIPRWITLLKENSNEIDAVDAYIEEELQIGEAYFNDDEWDDELDEDSEDFFTDDFEDDFLFDDFEEDFDVGEEWKELSEDFAKSEYGSLDTLSIYNDVRELAADTLQWAEGIHPKYHSPQYNEFISKILNIGAKVAAGYSFGFEQDYLGGNIAYTKKALFRANEALVLWQDHIKDAHFITLKTYLGMHRRLFELRNEIGVYVQELREQFYRGFE